MSRSHSVKSAVTESTVTEPVALHAASSPQYAAALASVTPELLALSASELLTINVDLAVVCTTVSGVLPGLLALRPQFAQLQGLDPSVVEPLELALIDKLPVYLGATAFAHAGYLYQEQALSPLPGLAADCGARFAVLAHAAQVFIDHGALPADALEQYDNKEQGYRPTALSTLHLAERLRPLLTPPSTDLVLTRATLDAAEQAGRALFMAVGERDRLEGAPNNVADLRQRAFTRLARAYDEARRGVGFLRWRHGDADTLAPSLYAGRAGTHAKTAPATKAPATVTATTAAPDATFQALTAPASATPGLAAAMPPNPLAKK